MAEPGEVSGPTAETQLRISKIVNRLDTSELAATYQRYAGRESQGRSRAEMADWLLENPPGEDFSRTVDEIREQLDAVDKQSSDGVRSAPLSPNGDSDRKTKKRAAPTEINVSWRPGEFDPKMSQGPDKTETKNRRRWALELAAERERSRAELGVKPGVKLVYWYEKKVIDPPDASVPETSLDLVYQTRRDDMTIASIAHTLGLDETFLLGLNKPLMKRLSLEAKLHKGTYVLLEDDVPSDMIDFVNEHLDPDGSSDENDDVDSDESDDERNETKSRKPTPTKKATKRKLYDDDRPEPDLDAWDKRSAAKLKGKAPRFKNLEEEMRGIKKMLRQQIAGKTPSASLLKKLGASDNDFDVPRKPAPRTAQGLRLNKAIKDTQNRIDGQSASDGQGEPQPLNAMDLFRLPNQTVETRLQRLEGSHGMKLHATPEALANASARMFHRHPLLSAEEKVEQCEIAFDRAEAMRTYIETAGMGHEETCRIMHKTQLDMLSGKSEDPMMKSFEKIAGSYVDKKAKKAVKQSAGGDKQLASRVLKLLGSHKKAKNTGALDSSSSESDSSIDSSSQQKKKGKSGKSARSKQVCSYCSFKGHTVENCWKKKKDDKKKEAGAAT